MAHEKLTDMDLEFQIHKIMNSFDFENVLNYMNDVGRKWYMGSERGMVCPDVDDLRFCARDLLTRAAYNSEFCTKVGTGGFMAYKMPWGMELTFQLTWSY